MLKAPPMKNFRELKVWEKSHQLTLDVYRVTRRFPKEEHYGLTNQLRRAVASIAANIAEGCGRGGEAEFGRFLQIAAGSASEVEYHLLLARDLELLPATEYEKLNNQISEIKRMLASLIQRVSESRQSSNQVSRTNFTRRNEAIS
jgi:four helix bundle protein